MLKVSKTQFIFYVLGILILTFGIFLNIQSNLGISPYDSLLVGLYQQIGLTVGSWEIIVSVIIIVLNSLLKRQPPELLGLLSAFITGLGIDMWLFLLQDFIQPDELFAKLFCLVSGIIILGLGTAIYLYANFAPIPIDRLMLNIHELTGMNILLSRTFIYLVFLGLGFLFKGPIGIGTLLTVCLGGPIINFFMTVIAKAANTSALRKNYVQKKHSL